MADTTAPKAATGVDLKNVDAFILIDTSGTMKEKDTGSGKTRLESAHESTSALAAELEKYDDDGITVIRFAGKVKTYDGVTHAKVDQIFSEFRPMGSTNTKEALQTAIDAVFAKRAAGSKKPGCIIVITDGEPDDKVGVAQVIVDATKKIGSRSELGILFVQVGKDDEATKYLKKLDNELTTAGAKFDIVATCHINDLEDWSVLETIEMAFTA